MELTRRDAAAALAAIGATGGIAAGAHLAQRRRGRDRDRDRASPSGGELPDDEAVRTALVAVAAVVYPDAVSGIPGFVDGFLDRRLARPEHATGMREAVAELDDLARDWYGGPVDELSVDERDRLLREVGADAVDEDPAGTTAERVRYYVVNELLLALYASPKGGELVGIENPQGHPGGADSYRLGPP